MIDLTKKTVPVKGINFPDLGAFNNYADRFLDLLDYPPTPRTGCLSTDCNFYFEYGGDAIGN